jgi:hypothetical protein
MAISNENLKSNYPVPPLELIENPDKIPPQNDELLMQEAEVFGGAALHSAEVSEPVTEPTPLHPADIDTGPLPTVEPLTERRFTAPSIGNDPRDVADRDQAEKDKILNPDYEQERERRGKLGLTPVRNAYRDPNAKPSGLVALHEKMRNKAR